MTLLRRHLLTLSASVVALALLVTHRVAWSAARRAVDLDLLLVLFALLIAVEILRASGWLDRAVAATVARFHTTRAFAVALVALTGILASLITNDVALFIVIPFTIVASRFSDFDVEDAVILEIVAANLIGCLTPLGNPQNLFVFHRSGWSAAHFVAVMLPFVAWSAAGILAATFLLGRSRPLLKTAVVLPPHSGRAAIAGAICFALVLLEIARVTNAWPAAIAAAVAAAIFLGAPRDGDRLLDRAALPLRLRHRRSAARVPHQRHAPVRDLDRALAGDLERAGDRAAVAVRGGGVENAALRSECRRLRHDHRLAGEPSRMANLHPRIGP